MATASSPAPATAAASRYARQAPELRGQSRIAPAKPALGSGWLREQRLHLRAEDAVGDGADVLGADAAPAVDEEGLGDAVDAVVDRHLSGGIAGIGEAQAELAHEALRGLGAVLDVDADHHHPAVAPRPPAALEHRRLVVAGRVAPRR